MPYHLISGDGAQVQHHFPMKQPLAASRERPGTRHRIVVALLLFLTVAPPLAATHAAYGTASLVQDSVPYPCDLALLARIAAAGESIGSPDLQRFLASPPTPNCPTNVEYGEWYNELLFGVLERYPATFSRTLNDLTPRTRDLVLSELTEPVNDGIDLTTARMHFTAPVGRTDSLIATALALATRHITHQFPVILGDDTLVDLSADSELDTLTVVWQPNGEPQYIELKRSAQRTDLRTLNPEDDLSWVRRIELVPPGIYAPPLLDAESGDLIVVDVCAAVRLLHDGVLLLPEETEGSLLIYVDTSGRLRFMYL